MSPLRDFCFFRVWWFYKDGAATRLWTETTLPCGARAACVEAELPVMAFPIGLRLVESLGTRVKGVLYSYVQLRLTRSSTLQSLRVGRVGRYPFDIAYNPCYIFRDMIGRFQKEIAVVEKFEKPLENRKI